MINTICLDSLKKSGLSQFFLYSLLIVLVVLNKVTERYARVGKKVHLKHLSSDCLKMLDNASAIVDVNYWEDPHYKLVSDELA